MMVSSGPYETRRMAESDRAGSAAAAAILRVASTCSLFVAIYLLRHADKSHAPTRLLALLCLAGVVLAWLIAHVGYAARYARLYYCRAGGLQFPGEGPPQYGDFAYFAFTIGMCFQVSDVTITGRKMRRTALGHALLSFAYNTAVLALALDSVANL